MYTHTIYGKPSTLYKYVYIPTYHSTTKHDRDMYKASTIGGNPSASLAAHWQLWQLTSAHTALVVPQHDPRLQLIYPFCGFGTGTGTGVGR